MKSDTSTGTYTDEIDFGVAGEVSYTVIADVDELSSTTWLLQMYTRETETDSWGEPMGTLGSDGVNNIGILPFPRFRYVRAVQTITGTDLPVGLIGY